MFYDFIYNIIANLVDKYMWAQAYAANGGSQSFGWEIFGIINNIERTKDYWATIGATVATIILMLTILVVGVKVVMHFIKLEQKALEA
jgi:hypothetical protein